MQIQQQIDELQKKLLPIGVKYWITEYLFLGFQSGTVRDTRAGAQVQGTFFFMESGSPSDTDQPCNFYFLRFRCEGH